MMTEKPCPVEMPKLLRAPSIVETCASCGAWVQRYPAFLGEAQEFWQCEKCGNTSTRRRQGRPFGPKSKMWPRVLEEWENRWDSIPPWDRNGSVVVCDPPLASLDWQAIEDWYASQNIYRMYIGFHVAEAE